ncbi:hypothetical protein KJ980_08935 [Patescibacteria group bacterium]|nr:hypothetical protein [Patescibacteria group bacterium]
MARALPETSSATDSAQQFNNDSATPSAAAALSGATYITNIYNVPQSSNAAILNNPTASDSALTNSLIASDSALTNTPVASDSAKPGAGLYLAMEQSTILSDVAIIGGLNIDGSLILANNAINTLGSNLQLQPLRQANLSIMGDLLVIDTDGNLKISGNANFAKDVTIKGQLSANIIAPIPDSDLIIRLNNNQKKSDSKSAIRNPQFVIQNTTGSAVLTVNQLGDIHASGSGTFSTVAANSFNIIRGAQADTSLVSTIASSSAGTAIITAYETERTIISPFITKDSLIYLTATSNTEGLTPYIARQTEKDFTIAIPYTINKDIKINWWIIN